MKYTVHDTTNGHLVSSHRTLQAAVKSKRKFLDRVERANGMGSYVHTEIREGDRRLSNDECAAALDYR